MVEVCCKRRRKQVVDKLSVIRMDTFSKTVAPGCRAGWITAQPLFIERLLRHTENSTQQPSGFVQSLLVELVKAWNGLEGWHTWLENLRDQYENRRNIMVDALVEGFPSSQDDVDGSKALIGQVMSFDEADYVKVSRHRLCSFIKPAGGMFVW